MNVSREVTILKDYKKVIILFLLSQIITVNNIMQMCLIPGSTSNIYIELWKSSSLMMVCIYYLCLFFGLLEGKNMYINYFSPKQGCVFFGDIIVKVLSAVITVVYINILQKNLILFILVQVFMAVVDIFMGVQIIKYIQILENSNLNQLESMLEEQHFENKK